MCPAACPCVLSVCAYAQNTRFDDNIENLDGYVFRKVFPDESFEHISQDATDLIKGLLQPDPQRRLTMGEGIT